ncbi:MAG TPA: cytochrome P450 [Ktedonobacteraceae bacterium]
MATTTQERASTQTALPPGPRPLPILGNLLSLRRDPLAFLQQIQRVYGDIATLYIGQSPIVLLSRPEYIRYVLVEHPRQFTSHEVAQNEGDDTAISEGLLSLDGEKHRQQRRAVQPAFHKKRVEHDADIMQQYTQDLLASWRPGDIVDMSRSMQELTVRIVGKCLFDLDLVNQLDTIGSTFNDLIGGRADVLETLFHLRIDHPLTSYGKRKAAMKRLDMLIYTLLAERRNEDQDRGDMLSMLLKAQTGEQPEQPLNDKQIHDHIVTFIAAGHETTANALIWTFYLLSKHPEIHAKLLNELHSVLGNRAPTVEDIAKLPYTEWVLQESMRLYPPAWIQARSVAEDIELDGTRIPAGTVVMMSQWVMHRRPDLWKDAEVFRPERWDPEQAQQLPAGAYFPFGAGPRICIGMPFAQLEAKIILINILQRFTPQTTPGYRAEVNPVITLRPKEHLRMRLLPASIDSEQDAARWNNLVAINDQTDVDRQGCLGLLLSLVRWTR